MSNVLKRKRVTLAKIKIVEAELKSLRSSIEDEDPREMYELGSFVDLEDAVADVGNAMRIGECMTDE